MSNESVIKKCAECGQTAHTSTTCNNGKVGAINLFGVTVNPQLDDEDGGLIRKSKSLEIMNLCNNANALVDQGYYSDEHGHGNGKKKGMTWTQKEHNLFLIGLEKLGKGDWKGISKEYVKSRTPTQVASHAQKYFLRVNSPQENGRRRSSLFDMPVHDQSFHAPPVAPPTTMAARASIPPPIPVATPTQITPLIAPPTPMATPTQIAPPTPMATPRPPCTSLNYGVRDYSVGFPNRNDRHFSPILSFLPVVTFPNQNRAYPYNGNWNRRFITRPPCVTHPPPITQGEPMIIELLDDDE